MGSQSGQATIDYVALIAVLAIVLALAVGVAPVGAAGIANAVTGQIRHALCLVGGGPCPDPRSKPCMVASRRDLRHFSVSAIIFRVDRDRYVLRETMSDGTVRLTVAHSTAAGLQAGVGASARVTVKGRGVGAADQARASLQLTFGTGTVYVARDEREADAFMRAIGDGRAPAPAREVFSDGGGRAMADAAIGCRARRRRPPGRAATAARARSRSRSARRAEAGARSSPPSEARPHPPTARRRSG